MWSRLSLPFHLCFPCHCERRNAQLEYALLLYFGKRYEEAWTELGCVLQVRSKGGLGSFACNRARVQLQAQRLLLCWHMRNVLQSMGSGSDPSALSSTPHTCLLPMQAAKSEAAQRVAVPTFDPEEIQQMEVLWEKIRLQLAFAA